MTLSCADLRWNELVEIISRLNRLNLSDEDIKNMSYHRRCETLNKNPVLVARHFQYRVEVFFKVIVLDGPLGKTSYYAIRVEFQVRGVLIFIHFYGYSMHQNFHQNQRMSTFDGLIVLLEQICQIQTVRKSYLS